MSLQERERELELQARTGSPSGRVRTAELSGGVASERHGEPGTARASQECRAERTRELAPHSIRIVGQVSLVSAAARHTIDPCDS